jgi:hypothetical protein
MVTGESSATRSSSSEFWPENGDGDETDPLFPETEGRPPNGTKTARSLDDHRPFLSNSTPPTDRITTSRKPRNAQEFAIRHAQDQRDPAPTSVLHWQIRSQRHHRNRKNQNSRSRSDGVFGRHGCRRRCFGRYGGAPTSPPMELSSTGSLHPLTIQEFSFLHRPSQPVSSASFRRKNSTPRSRAPNLFARLPRAAETQRSASRLATGPCSRKCCSVP